MKLLGIALQVHPLSSGLSLSHLVAGISLSVPTTNVVASTSVDCQWTANATDPAAFALVMQFSNASSLFGEFAAVTTVQRGTTTNGTVPNIKNVAVPGCVWISIPLGLLFSYIEQNASVGCICRVSPR
jgi:hypothetical protein